VPRLQRADGKRGAAAADADEPAGVQPLHPRAEDAGHAGYSQKVLSEAQAADIYAYVLSLPKAPELKDVPLLGQLPQ
jgi:hypothetical protein